MAFDVVLTLWAMPGTGRPDHELQAISLRDGRQIWSHRLDFKPNVRANPQVAVADLDGDGRPEVIVTEQPAAGDSLAFVLKALDGRDATVRWTWNGGASDVNSRWVYGWLALANFSGDGRKSVCLRFVDTKGQVFILVFDEHGNESARRGLPQNTGILGVADVDGDGRDELLIAYDDRLHAWKADLTELWSSPRKDLGTGHFQFLPGPAGQAGTIIAGRTVGLDGSTGSPRWADHSVPDGWSNQFTVLVDRGDSRRSPTMMSAGMGVSVCRAALPTTPMGAYLPARGQPVVPGLTRDDPRWMRPLPWTHALERYVSLWGVFGVIAPALFNVFLPLAILRLVALKRPWTLRLLMALPVAAAIPLTAVVIVEPMIPILPPPFPSSSRVVYALGSLAGVPVVSLAAASGWTVVLRRWKHLALLIGVTALMSLAIGLVWLRIDVQAMPAIERYSWSGWSLAVLPGAYAVGVLVVISWTIRGMRGQPRRPGSAAVDAVHADAARSQPTGDRLEEPREGA